MSEYFWSREGYTPLALLDYANGERHTKGTTGKIIGQTKVVAEARRFMADRLCHQKEDVPSPRTRLIFRWDNDGTGDVWQFIHHLS
ncbi:hypothetical protein AYO44_04715 [Planctomycetaceae bacterium SCGC AG-212-F19]|nr:hypothetical protein AYO44_04715 [Planctomycetaceae bacterium SCGC AG-212-F19]